LPRRLARLVRPRDPLELVGSCDSITHGVRKLDPEPDGMAVRIRAPFEHGSVKTHSLKGEPG
jgi:hypothetical protein